MSKRGRPPFEDVLTPAEWRVCEGVRHGLTNPQIAKRMAISVDAVKYHVANATQKLGFSNRKQLRQWDGVRKSSALSGASAHANPSAMPGTIGQVSRSVADLRAAEQWYRDVLGLKPLYAFGNMSFFDCDGVRLFLCESARPTPESILYFRVDDIHAHCESLKNKGVEFISAPHLIHTHADGTEEWMAFFNDQEGRPLALMSTVAPDPA
ncbi:MAG: hypothetical protein E6Q50_11555 [Lysobacter sp.]|nr:MAG: hypothetical protein E6Q50_11555 [Lysobacter sp.]